MDFRSLKAVGLAAAGSLLMAAGAQAAPTADATVTIDGQGALYKEVKRPVNVTFNANITPGPGEVTLDPLMETKYSLPKDLAFVPDPKMPVCTQVNAGNSNFSGQTAKSLCPNSIVGDGVANILLAQQTSALITDPEITIFNGGRNSSGGGILGIHAYSASTNAGIFMTGAIRNGVLDVLIPRLTADSSTSTFTLSIPGSQGQDKGYAEATCSTGTYDTSAVFTLGKRDAAGNVSGQSVLNTTPTSQTCVGNKGRAQFKRLGVKGPKKVRNGRKAKFKVTITNRGTATARNVRVKAFGQGKGFKKARNVAAGRRTSVWVKTKVKGRKGSRAVVKFKATANGAKAVGKTRVRIK